MYCGNNLSAKMLGQMTPHEVEFFQRLDPPKSFTLGDLRKLSLFIGIYRPTGGAERI